MTAVRQADTVQKMYVLTRDLHGDGDRGIPTGMEASVAGFPRGWTQMLRDSHGDGKIFYGIPAGM